LFDEIIAKRLRGTLLDVLDVMILLENACGSGISNEV